MIHYKHQERAKLSAFTSYLKSTVSLNYSDIRKIVTRANATIVFYYLMNNETEIAIWVITPGESQKTQKKPPWQTVKEKILTSQETEDQTVFFKKLSISGGETLRDVIQDILQYVSKSNPKHCTTRDEVLQHFEKNSLYNKRFKIAMKKLYSVLIAPIAKQLLTEEVIIVPHGILSLVPFACLYDDVSNTYFIEQYTFSISPSIRMIEEAQRNLEICKVTKEKQLEQMSWALLVSNKEHDAELSTISKILIDATAPNSKQRQLFITNATKQKLIQPLKITPAILHLNCQTVDTERTDLHVEFYPTGKLQLAKESLSLKELSSHDLTGSELVVLKSSTFSTLTEDGISGIYKALFAAGASSILGTLWSLHDVISQEFITRFYEYLLGLQGMKRDKPTALRNAILDMFTNYSIRQYPMIWGSVFLIGDFRKLCFPDTLLDGSSWINNNFTIKDDYF
jgi:CHAT domain-containing protein